MIMGSRPCRGRYRISLYSPHFGQFDELPWARHVPAGYLDQRRLVLAESRLKRLPQRLRTARTIAANPEALGKPDEIRVGEVGADQPVAVEVALHVAHIAIGAVVEDDDDKRNAMTHRGRQLLHIEHEAAVARDRDHRHIAERVLGPKRGGDAPAERALVAGRDVSARRARLIRIARRIADLGELIDDDAVVRQYITDRIEIAELRGEHREIGRDLILELATRRDAISAHRR